MKIWKGAAVAIAATLSAGASSAIDFSISGLVATDTDATVGPDGRSVTISTPPAAVDGETLTFDITMRNLGGTDIGAFGASIVGYNLDGNAATNVVSFSGPSGTTGAELFSTTAFGTMAFGGVGNSQTAPAETTVSVETFVRLASVFNTTAGGGSGDGTLDIGVSGVASDSSPHFTVIFDFTGVGTGFTLLSVGVVGEGDAASSVAGAPLTNNNTNVAILIPEPASTLSGLSALVALAGIGLYRNRRS